MEASLWAIAGVGFGTSIGVLGAYYIAIRPLMSDIRQMRYQGFRPDLPLPERPKTVPLPFVRED